MRVLHIIVGLGDGGAEGVLSRLCMYNNSSKHTVISFMGEGKYEPILKDAGVEVISLGLQPGKFNIKQFIDLIRLIKLNQPDVVQTWMYHADLLGGVAARLAGIKNIFWGIRHSTLEPGKSKRSTILIAKLCSFLSHIIPTKIICCAYDAQKVHKKLGYNKRKLLVIQNGYDLNKFKPDHESRKKIRDEFNVKNKDFLIGTVGRYDPQKDHLNLLKALNILLKKNIGFKCILIGKGLTSANKALVEDISNLGLSNNIILGGMRSDVPKVMNALDLHVLPSAYGEGFPNVVAEAMACGVPCIATDVGDSDKIVLTTDFLCPPREPKLLSKKIESYYTLSDDVKSVMRIEASNKIIQNYSINKMVDSFECEWRKSLEY
ncbi:glycosyltransferase [Pseudoalteromonas arctica]|uniref:glycosyltransferase family 4 protein n=1 Tax=Pseudoalteromonas arctica TaxID=394751 RepID=UPI001C9C7003|nr:glycosyltransferase [Pseudoalteromonas arctica]MBZ2192813.1 glycosyltransferase [Pseudoalteromonas arctica]